MRVFYGTAKPKVIIFATSYNADRACVANNSLKTPDQCTAAAFRTLPPAAESIEAIQLRCAIAMFISSQSSKDQFGDMLRDNLADFAASLRFLFHCRSENTGVSGIVRQQYRRKSHRDFRRRKQSIDRAINQPEFERVISTADGA
jgi:hypothetical protein